MTAVIPRLHIQHHQATLSHFHATKYNRLAEGDVTYDTHTHTQITLYNPPIVVLLRDADLCLETNMTSCVSTVFYFLNAQTEKIVTKDHCT